ncbi:MAG TPA: CpaD family pilus assembly lipoprotein [Allosphingosinicella sp.]|nr:CpaD family pilus assembly lipoprotein [Allosphingosinicella sp.]
MSRTLTLAAVAALGLGASGCASPTGGLTATNNPSVYSVHQPVVQHTNYVLDLTTSGDRVPQSELERLDGWLASIGASYGDRISIDEAEGYASEGARGDVARVAADHGLLLSDGAPILNGSVQPGTIRVIASRATASVPGCPNWGTPQLAASTHTSPNFGCSINSNLAAMIANPDDLVLGQDGSTTGSATTATRAIRTYRQRQPTGQQGLPATSTTGNQ